MFVSMIILSSLSFRFANTVVFELRIQCCIFDVCFLIAVNLVIALLGLRMLILLLSHLSSFFHCCIYSVVVVVNIPYYFEIFCP